MSDIDLFSEAGSPFDAIRQVRADGTEYRCSECGRDNPVDSEVFTLPDGQTVIGRDAYEAEMTRRVFRRYVTER